jgi:hypothetical protein
VNNTVPHNKTPMDERKLRQDLVHVFGADSEQVQMLDEILHRMWAGESEIEELLHRDLD